MITEPGIALTVLEIVALAVDEDTCDEKYAKALQQLFGLRLGLRAMNIHFSWHREVAAWEKLLQSGEDPKKIQQIVWDAFRMLKENGHIEYLGFGNYITP